MPANIAQINGKDAVFTAVKPAWHQLGITTPSTLSWFEAMTAAQLNWNVEKIPFFSAVPKLKSPANPKGAFQVPDVLGVYRDSDGAYLGAVGTGYEVIQNREMFAYVDDLLQATDGAHYESAGALGNGEVVWTMARLPQDSVIRGTKDITQNYLLFTGSHDGSTKNTVKLVRERVVCANTLALALGEEGKQLTFKHTKNVRIRMDEAKKIWLGVNQQIAAQNETDNILANRRITRETFTAVLNRLFPENKQAESQKKRENILVAIAERYVQNDGDKIPEVKGTAWNLLNAVTQYVDHDRAVRITSGRQGMTETQARAENALFGTGDAIKSAALTAVLEETVSAPSVSEQRGVVKPFNPQTDSQFLKSLGIRG